MPINSKKKGSRNERNLSKLFHKWTGFEFARTPSSGGLRWKKRDDVVGDITCTDQDHLRIFPFSIETKFHDEIQFNHLLLGNTSIEIIKWWKQTTDDAARSGKLPLLMMRYNGMPSDTYFTVVYNSLYNRLIPALGSKYGYLKSDRGFTIFNSDDMFSANYPDVIKICKTYSDER